MCEVEIEKKINIITKIYFKSYIINNKINFD